jgi:hypothetical protein
VPESHAEHEAAVAVDERHEGVLVTASQSSDQLDVRLEHGFSIRRPDARVITRGADHPGDL